MCTQVLITVGLVTRNCPQGAAQFLCIVLLIGKCHPVYVTSLSSLQVYVGGKVESCFVAADLIEVIQVFSWNPYCWIPKANFSFRILLLKKQGTEWSLRKQSHFAWKEFLSLLNIGVLWQMGERERVRARGWRGGTQRACTHMNVWANTGPYILMAFSLLKTLWSACLGPTSEVCASFRAVNYQLWVLETASRLWYRAGEPCVLCCPSCWISNKYQRIRNCPLLMLLMVLRLIIAHARA